MKVAKLSPLSGGCLCGGVRYRISGACRNIINCHCENCRRTHGHVAAYTLLHQSDLQFSAKQSLQWYHDASPDTWRGFCNRCGASLFWDAGDGSNNIAVAAGSLDDASRLTTIGHVFVAEAGKYYEISDGLPQFDRGSEGALGADESG